MSLLKRNLIYVFIEKNNNLCLEKRHVGDKDSLVI
jgi:hypothetical protein